MSLLWYIVWLVFIKFLGDMMGPTISGITALIRLSTGCGEQNMIRFVPNIFVIIYLNSMNALTPDVLIKAKGFILKGIFRNRFIIINKQSTYLFYKRSTVI